METDEVIKLVDNIYKNILEKFNPGARQLISAGKAYLKALHGAAAASRVFNEALAKIAVNAQQGGTNDIGSALMNIVGVYKEIQDQHMNILKAFYVDLLVPLETNLEKDTKVVQFEQKKFLQQHKIRADSYSKAAATMKKQRKKKSNAQNADKEIKSIQAMDEEKNKLDAFCEQSLKNAMTQERRRYGFVLERQCSLAKHWIAYHTSGKSCLSSQIDSWEEVSSSREFLPPNMENIFAKNIMERYRDDESDRGSIRSAMRKTKSIDASILDMRSLGDVVNSSVMHMPRAKSEYNLTCATPEVIKYDQRPVARALFSYLASGENQLTFHENDRIALVGERAKGWQFGENLRTQLFGWFPIAYTEFEVDDLHSNWTVTQPRPNGHSNGNHHQQQQPQQQGHHNSHPRDHTPDSSLDSSTLIEEDESVSPVPSKLNSYHHDEHSPTRMFGDTIMYRQSKQFRRVTNNGNGNVMVPKPGPPPTLPAPVPSPIVPSAYTKSHLTQSHSFSSNGGPPLIENRKSLPATTNFSKQQSAGIKPKPRNGGVTSASLHSSNDSGFANDPPPQPEVDYSDEETLTRIPIRSQNSATLKHSRIPRRCGENDTNTLKSNKTNRTSPDSRNMRQSSSFGNLTDEQSMELIYRTADRRNGNLIKRTKSFWKFGKSDDEILEGMAMWRHRDLVQTDNEKNDERNREATLKRLRKKSLENVNSISTNSSETLKNGQNGSKHDLTLILDDTGVKYPMTKSDIDLRVQQQQQQKHEEQIYGVIEVPVQRTSQNVVSRSKLVRQSYMEMEQDEPNNNTISNTNTSKAKRSQPSHPQPQVRTSKSGYAKVSNGGKSTSAAKMAENQDIIEFYDTRHLNTLQKRKHTYDDADLEDASLITTTPSSGRHTTADAAFFDDESVNGEIIMKTVNRQEILKQYYSSDTERHSASSSDPYDCIVVEDHLVRKENEKNKANNAKLEFSTFRGDEKDSETEQKSRTATLLPRTKLTKTSSKDSGGGNGGNGGGGHQQASKRDDFSQANGDKRDRRNGAPHGGGSGERNRNSDSHARQEHDRKKTSSNGNRYASNDNPRSSSMQHIDAASNKSYGQWYDLWGRDASVNMS